MYLKHFSKITRYFLFLSISYMKNILSLYVLNSFPGINSSSYDAIISIFKQLCPNLEILLEESLRMLKPGGILIIYESFQENPQSVYNKRVSNLKLTGFKVKEQESFDTKQLKGLLLNIYNNIDNICEVVAEKPSFEVSDTYLSSKN